MNPKVRELILQMLKDRGLPNNDDNFRMIASELGRRGARVKAQRAKQRQAQRTKTTPTQNKRVDNTPKPIQGQFNFPESFDSKVNYILKDLLF